jgi:hypothetical protein
MPDDSKGPGPTPDELHTRFRAALDRKAGRHQSGASDGPGDPAAKASTRTANSKRQREFRRKSGG